MYALKGRVIDSVSDDPIENGLVLIRDECIEFAGRAAECVIPEQARVI
jgi:hypothetical protein